MKQVARERQLMKQRQLDEAAGGGGGDEQQQQQQQEKEEREPLLTFTPSVELSDLVRPADRWVDLLVGRGGRGAPARPV